MDAIEKKIINIIDAQATQLQSLAQDLFLHAEQGYHEYRTAKIVADFLKGLGLTCKEGLANTGIRTSLGSKNGPHIALISELDGIKCPEHPCASGSGYSHSCGHYAQVVCMLGAAMALTDPEVAKSLDGMISFFAVPAEEYQDFTAREEICRSSGIRCPGGKQELLLRGEFDDIDMAISTHTLMVGRENGLDLMLGNSASTGFIGKTICVKGRAAHAASSPHLGVNALNAACLGISALGMIRETFQEKDCVRIHTNICQQNGAINVVPSEVTVNVMIRANQMQVVETVGEKVNRCFEGAAFAIGCETVITDSLGYMPCPELPPNRLMWDTASLIDAGRRVEAIPTGVCNMASTDLGDLFAVMPVMNFLFGGSSGALHSKDYQVTDPYVAHILPAKMMALLAYRLLKGGAVEAKSVIHSYTPPYSLQEYKNYILNKLRDNW